ncbi:tRNA (adenosine(37)-N6)-dimethylallyltransferase MiaA [Thermoproteota archaeon]
MKQSKGNPIKDILLVIGPTAIGKTEFACQKARELNAEIISADAFQVYRHMDIGTAKVSKEIRAEIPHHLIDIKDPDESYSAAEFVELANQKITEIQARHKSIIICGGTGFYINAFLNEFSFAAGSEKADKTPDSEIRSQIQREIDEQGAQTVWDQLKKIDPDMADLVHPSNTKRLIRAMEIYELTKTPPSKLRQKALEPRQDVQIIGLTAPRSLIYDRINKRVDHMIESGLVQEVMTLLKMGYSKDCQAFQALGYKEVIAEIQSQSGVNAKGSIPSQEMIQLLKQRTRHFAKRQLTWFRRFKHVFWIDISN